MKIIEQKKLNLCIVIEDKRHSFLALNYLKSLKYKIEPYRIMKGNAGINSCYFIKEGCIECKAFILEDFLENYNIIYSNTLFQ